MAYRYAAIFLKISGLILYSVSFFLHVHRPTIFTSCPVGTEHKQPRSRNEFGSQCFIWDFWCTNGMVIVVINERPIFGKCLFCRLYRMYAQWMRVRITELWFLTVNRFSTIFDRIQIMRFSETHTQTHIHIFRIKPARIALLLPVASVAPASPYPIKLGYCANKSRPLNWTYFNRFSGKYWIRCFI